MSTLNFSVTATQAEFNDFANKLGYMENILNVAGLPIPNTETRNNFLVRIMKEKVATTFYTPFTNEVDSQIVTTRDAEKEGLRNIIRGRVAVTFTV